MAFPLFESLLNGLRVDVTQQIGRVRPLTEEERQAMMQQMLAQQIQAQGAQQVAAEQEAEALDVSELPEGWEQTGRNEACPCGSRQNSSIATVAYLRPAPTGNRV